MIRRRRHMGFLASLTVVGALAAAACTPSAGAEELRGSANYAPASIAEVDAGGMIDATERIGLEMLLDGDAGENVVVSPASFAFAFAMLAAGATADGAAELTELLGVDAESAAEVAGALLVELSQWDNDPSQFDPETAPQVPVLHLANRLVVQEGFEAEETYLDGLAQNFDAGLTLADFTDETSAKEILDTWVNHHTAGLIEESGIEPRPNLVLVLQNALLFGAQWETTFEDHLTRDREFTPVDGASFQVPMMSADGLMVRYVEQDGWSAVELPYTDGFVANFFLPPQGQDPLAVDGEASAGGMADGVVEGSATDLDTFLDGLAAELAAADPVEVAVVIPKIDTKSETGLVDLLQDLGYSAIFDCSAGAFRGIAQTDLCVDQAVQQVVLKVDEEGTVAAAVTEIGVEESAAPIPEREFVADRPFLMTIRSIEPGWDLFQAVIRDPRVQEG